MKVTARPFRFVAIDAERLSALVSSALGRPCRLTPLQIPCTHPVYRGETAGGADVFVKVGELETWRRTARLLGDIGGEPFVPRLVVETPLAYDGYAVTVMEWREATVVFPEDMTDAQADSFVAACETLSRIFRKTRAFEPILGSPQDPERLYAILQDYVRRHPFSGRILRCLTEIPAARRTFGNRPLSVLHGDFHAKNFGFAGDDFARVVDFDKVTEGLHCGDLVNALCERFSSLSLSESVRRRLKRVSRRIVAASAEPREELEICCNILRLRFAVSRILKHPNASWVALDILRRDRKIREFLT